MPISSLCLTLLSLKLISDGFTEIDRSSSFSIIVHSSRLNRNFDYWSSVLSNGPLRVGVFGSDILYRGTPFSSSYSSKYGCEAHYSKFSWLKFRSNSWPKRPGACLLNIADWSILDTSEALFVFSSSTSQSSSSSSCTTSWLALVSVGLTCWRPIYLILTPLLRLLLLVTLRYDCRKWPTL